MSPAVLLLVLVSCVLHAGWNLQVKRWNTTPGFFLVATLLTVAVTTPFFWLAGGGRVSEAPPILWLCLLLTGLCQALYYLCLARAYRHGDLSLVYPLARTTPLFVVPLAGLVRDEWPTAMALTGILLAVAGCFVLPRPRLDFWSERRVGKLCSGHASRWALATALASSGYTVADAVGMAALRPVLPGMRGAFFYGYLEGLATVLWMSLPLLAGTGRKEIVRVWHGERGRALLIGSLIFLTYLLILWAYSLTDRVAYVAGMRQLSLVLGVLGGIHFLNEPRSAPRLTGSFIIVIGLALIALAR